MARVELVIKDLNATPYSAVINSGTAGTVDGQVYDLTGNEVVIVENVGVGALDITFPVARGVGGETIDDRVENVGAGVIKAIGDFEPSIFKHSDGGRIDFPGGSEADLKVTIARHKRPE
jgi:hypothetical protein